MRARVPFPGYRLRGQHTYLCVSTDGDTCAIVNVSNVCSWLDFVILSWVCTVCNQPVSGARPGVRWVTFDVMNRILKLCLSPLLRYLSCLFEIAGLGF